LVSDGGGWIFVFDVDIKHFFRKEIEERTEEVRVNVDGFIVNVKPAHEAGFCALGDGPVASMDMWVVLLPCFEFVVGEEVPPRTKFGFFISGFLIFGYEDSEGGFGGMHCETHNLNKYIHFN